MIVRREDSVPAGLRHLIKKSRRCVSSQRYVGDRRVRPFLGVLATQTPTDRKPWPLGRFDDCFEYPGKHRAISERCTCDSSAERLAFLKRRTPQRMHF